MAAPQTPGFVGGGAGLLGVDRDPNNPDKYIARFANGNVIPMLGQTGKNLYDRQQAVAKLSAPQPQQPAERVGTTVTEEPKMAGGLPPDAPAEQPQQERPSGPVSLGQTLEATDPATGQKFTGEAFRMPDGTVRVMRAGTAGSPGGLTALGKQVIGEQIDAQNRAAPHFQRSAEAQQVGVDIAVADAEARDAYVQKQQELNLLEQHRKQDEEREIQSKVDVLNQKYELARQTFADARVDPTRIGKGGKNWLFGLSAALGAFGAGLARTPNFAMDFINARVADDIRAQEAEINVKGRDADNQLANLTRSLGDLKLAKTAYRQLKLEETSLAAQRIAGQFKGQAIAANALMVAEQAAGASAIEGQKRSQENMEHILKDKLYYRQGTAGTRGGLYLTGTNELQGRKNLEAEDKAKGPEAEAAARAVPKERTDMISSLAGAIDAADRIEKNIADRGMGEDNTVDDPLAGGYDAIARGASSLVGGDRVKLDNQLAADTFKLARGIQTDYGKSDNDARMADEAAKGTGSAADRVRAARQTREASVKKIRQELGTLQPNQQEVLLSTMSPEARAAVLGKK